MGAFGILILCLAAGFILRRVGVFGPTAHETLGRFVLWISLPALTLVNLRKIAFAPSLGFAVLMPWLVFFLGFGFFSLLSRTGRLPRADLKTIAALTLVCGLGNTSFLGFPMLEAIYGPDAIPPATLLDQLGTFLALSIPGVALASAAAEGSASPRAVFGRVLRFPPFWALIVGLASRPFSLSADLLSVFERLGATLTPLALAAVGCQLDLSLERILRLKNELFWGLSYKLLLAPLVIWGLAATLGLPRDLVFRVTVLEAAMAPMISAGIIALQFRLREELASQLVALGILLSLLTVPVWSLLLR